LAIICAVLTIWLKEHIIILATSIVGAYACVKMIGTMAGNYPDEATVVRRIEAGEIDGMPWAVWLYLSITVVLAIVGVIVQYKIFAKKKKPEGELPHADYKRYVEGGKM